jgi:hypothetical protein
MLLTAKVPGATEAVSCTPNHQAKARKYLVNQIYNINYSSTI